MADQSLRTSYGGQNTGNVSAGGAVANQTLVTGAGRLCRVVQTSLGNATVGLTFYDNASNNTSGVPLCTIIGNSTLGQVGAVFDVQMPYALGLVAQLKDGTPAVAFSYNANTSFGT